MDFEWFRQGGSDILHFLISDLVECKLELEGAFYLDREVTEDKKPAVNVIAVFQPMQGRNERACQSVLDLLAILRRFVLIIVNQ